MPWLESKFFSLLGSHCGMLCRRLVARLANDWVSLCVSKASLLTFTVTWYQWELYNQSTLGALWQKLLKREAKAQKSGSSASSPFSRPQVKLVPALLNEFLEVNAPPSIELFLGSALLLISCCLLSRFYSLPFQMVC